MSTYYEMVGQGVVWGLAGIVSLWIAFNIFTYLSIAGALIYVHCFKGKGVNDEYKAAHRFWRVRIGFNLLFQFKFIYSFFNSTSMRGAGYYIEFEGRWIPKVSTYEE